MRHQIAVLQRQAKPPRLSRVDRAQPAPLARLLPGGQLYPTEDPVLRASNEPN